MTHPTIAALLWLGILACVVFAAVVIRRSVRRIVVETLSRQPFTAASFEEETPSGHTAECWAQLTDPGATCVCKPWSAS